MKANFSRYADARALSWRFFIAAVMLVPLSGCDILGFHHWTWSQRLTITVNTPEGTKTASSVAVVRWEKTPGFLMGLGGGGYAGSLTGEAVVLEIAPSKYLFTLLGDRYDAGTALDVFSQQKGGWNDQLTENALNALEQASHQHTLSTEYYPSFVTFRDIADPSSVVPVAPEAFEKEFGMGTSIATVTLSITDEKAADSDFARILPWWQSYKNDKQLDGNRYVDIRSSHRYANSLNSLNFKRD